MARREDFVKWVLQAADGKIVGRIRLQKIFYLLEQFGLGSGLRFSYHHYGPYSEELSSGILHARYLEKSIDEKEELTSYGAPYSVYTLSVEEFPPEFIGDIQFKKAHGFITEMKEETSVVLELAATIYWLKENEGIADWKKELKIRKPTKATPELIVRAEQLLSRIEALV